MEFRAAVFDADRTLWDHYNISELVEPMKVSGDVLVDGTGNKVNLYPRVRETFSALREKGIILGLATWNVESITKRVLELFRLKFDIIISREYPYKFLMLSEFLLKAKRMGVEIRPEEVLYIDDRRDHFGYIWFHLGKVKCVEMWKEINDYSEILKIVNV